MWFLSNQMGMFEKAWLGSFNEPLYDSSIAKDKKS